VPFLPECIDRLIPARRLPHTISPDYADFAQIRRPISHAFSGLSQYRPALLAVRIAGAGFLYDRGKCTDFERILSE
jgi:hypothetical protein